MTFLRCATAFFLATALAAAEGAIGVVFMDDPSPGVLAHFGGVDAGAVITETIPEGPAAKAGLKLGDVITKVNGEAVADFEELSKAVGALAPGATAEITFRRHREKADGHDEKTVAVGIVDREAFWKATIEREEGGEKP